MQLSYDICILGAGPAGVAAAIAARRFGASVLLVDRAGVPGGMATHGGLNIWCGDAPSSVFSRILEETTQITSTNRRIFAPEVLKATLIDMLETAGAELLLHAWATGVETENGRMTAALLQTKSGTVRVEATTFLDCTGDGDIAALCGVPFAMGREGDGKTQPMTVEFAVGGVDTDRAVFGAEARTPRIMEAFRRYLEEGKISFPVSALILIESVEPHTARVNMTNVIDCDGTNVFHLTRAEIAARKQIPQIVAFLRQNVPGYENCCAIHSATWVGVRESRRITGRYCLCPEDIQQGRVFEDWIVEGANYCFNAHDPAGQGASSKGSPKNTGASYTIPYRCFTPVGMENLLVAGRCISGDHHAMSSYRVMPICFAMGEGAGTCAAVALRDSTPATALTRAQITRVQTLLRESR